MGPGSAWDCPKHSSGVTQGSSQQDAGHGLECGGHWISGMWAQLRLCQLTSGAENHLAQGQSSHFLGSLRLANSIISCLACGSFSSQSLHCLQKQAQLLAGNKRIPEIIERLGLERTEWFGFTGTLVSFQPRAMGRDAYNMEINFNLTIEC